MTRVCPDIHRSGHLILFLDGARYASLPAELVRALGLEPGMDLTGDTKAELKGAARTEAAYRAAQASVASRPRARRDLVRRLRQRGHQPDAAEAAADRLEARGVLDDERYARDFASFRTEKGHGRRRVLRDLLAAGVDRGQAELAIDEAIGAGANPLDRVREQVERRAARIRDLPRSTQRRRLLAFLARRGHEGAEARQLVDTIVAG